MKYSQIADIITATKSPIRDIIKKRIKVVLLGWLEKIHIVFTRYEQKVTNTNARAFASGGITRKKRIKQAAITTCSAVINKPEIT